MTTPEPHSFSMLFQERVGDNITGVIPVSTFGILPPGEETPLPKRRRQAEDKIWESQAVSSSMKIPSGEASHQILLPQGCRKQNEAAGEIIFGGQKGAETAALTAPTGKDGSGNVSMDRSLSSPPNQRQPEEEEGVAKEELFGTALVKKMMHLFQHGTQAALELELVKVGEERLRALRTPDVGAATCEGTKERGEFYICAVHVENVLYASAV